ncbi:hypothetical protein [Paenibacillus sp. FSL W7-1332]|uniref:hypothetical protein n=1 Tax=Paenibacillus sp. FSL W7-1332 TaxID=2921702 RepID=UPI0030D2851D
MHTSESPLRGRIVLQSLLSPNFQNDDTAEEIQLQPMLSMRVGEAQRSRARAVYINKPNEPFGAYIPNGLFAFTPSLNHRLDGSNHPRNMVEARLGQARSGAAWALLGDEARQCRVLRMPTSFLSQASTEQAELFWRSGSGPLYSRISTWFYSFRRNLGVTGIGRTIRMRSDEQAS